jgi:hypothetical protein
MDNLSHIETGNYYSSRSRRSTPWTIMPNENLKFALDLLSLHHSPHEIEVANEIQKRIVEGRWMNLDNHPPISRNVNFRGFLPYLWLILGILAGVVAVGSWFAW